jgi:hypothetical protein
VHIVEQTIQVIIPIRGAKCIVFQDRNFLIISIISCRTESLSTNNEINMLFMADIWLCFSSDGIYYLFRTKAVVYDVKELEPIGWFSPAKWNEITWMFKEDWAMGLVSAHAHPC